MKKVQLIFVCIAVVFLAIGYLLYSNTSEKVFEEKDRPDLAAAQNFEMTKDPALGYPPVRRLVPAYEFIKSQKRLGKKNGKAIEGVDWVERGPNNVSGRTRALLFDPNDVDAKRLFAGGIGGGLWVNDDITDENSPWVAVDDFLANIAISSIAYDPSNTMNMYLGTGLGFTGDIRGVGIFKSTDGGFSWSLLSSTSTEDFESIQKIAVTEDGIVLAAARVFGPPGNAEESGGIWRSADDGQTWSKVLGKRGADIEIATDGVIYATVGFGNGSGEIHKSSDNGLTWEDISPTDPATRIELAVAPSNPEVIYAVADGGSGSQDVAWFKKSIDGGLNWSDITIPLYYEQNCQNRVNHFTRGQAFFDLILGVDNSDPDILIAGGIDLHRSRDGGENWELISYWTGACDILVHADQHAMISRPGYEDEWVFGNDGGVYYSSNATSADDPQINSRKNGFNVTTFYACAMENEAGSNYYLAGAQDNGSQQFTIPGINNTVEVTGGDGAFCFIDQDDPNIQITSFVFNSYRLSLDGGQSFFNISNDQSQGRFINPSDYDDDANILYAAGSSGNIVRYSNLGTSTSIIDLSISGMNGVVSHIRASPYSDNTIFLGTGNGQLFKVTNANASPVVEEITGDLPSNYVSCIEIGANEDQLLVTHSNYGVTSVWETMDSGGVWSSKEGNLPDIPIRWALYNPNNLDEVLLATEVGVWSTDDLSLENPVWEPSVSGLANVRCDMLQIRDADQKVAVATYGRGLFTSDVFSSNVSANFDVNSNVGYVGSEFIFSDGSLNADSWLWDFGDGSTSTLENPNHIYASSGNYDVNLTINGSASTLTKEAFITVLPDVNTPYLSANGGDFESNMEDFASDDLFGGIDIWELGIPEGVLSNVSSGVNAWKTNLADSVFKADYRCALYSPSFDMSDEELNYVLSFRKSMEAPGSTGPYAVQVQYTLDNGSGWTTLGDFERVFGDPQGVNWYNKNPLFSGAINTNVIGNQKGWIGDFDNELTEYNVSFLSGNSQVAFRIVLSVVSNFGDAAYRDGFMVDDFQIITSNPLPEFNIEKNIFYVGENVEFNYLSGASDQISWSFGDGTSSNSLDPIKSYDEPGLYTISLEVNGNTTTKTDLIQVLPMLSIPFTLENGGDLESNTLNFGALNRFGTGFELGSSTIENKDGTFSGDNAWVTGLTEENYQANSEAFLYTPLFDFSSLGEYELAFRTKYAFETDWEGYQVEYTLDRGITWKLLGSSVAADWYNRTAINGAIAFAPANPLFSQNTSGEFVEKKFDLTFLEGSESVGLRFAFRTDPNTEEEGGAIDDITVSGPASGPGIPEFRVENATGCNGQTVVFVNQSSGSISELEWDFGENATPRSASGSGPFTVTYQSEEVVKNTVTLTSTSPENGIQVNEKVDLINIAPLHEPSFVVNSNNGITVLEASEGDSYQWFEGGLLIEGANERQFQVTNFFIGYTVVVGVDGCQVESDNQFVVVGAEEELNQNTTFTIFPNPTSDRVNVSLDNSYIGQVNVIVLDALGSVIENKIYDKDSKNMAIQVDLMEYGSGMYYIKLDTGTESITKSIMKLNY
ncbi:MAG: PKD domain-containing protein [Fulvivirga sp.]